VYHTTAWLVWLLAGLVPALMTSNPLYLVLLLAAITVDYRILGRRSALTVAWQPFLKIGLVLVVFGVLLNLLFAHGGKTVLFVLPSWKWLVGPESRVALVSVGGPVALEGIVFGVTRGVGLITILVLFATFNSLVDTAHLMRSLPKFMYQTGVVASIAISFVPQTILALREIREAQMVRGHQFRGILDLLPLFLPLLTTGLERAMQLAESMEARGFGSQGETSPRQEITTKGIVALALALLVIAVVWLGFGPSLKRLGFVVMGVAVVLLIGVFRSMGSRVQRSRYVRELWRSRDTLLTVLCAVSLAIVLVFKQVEVGFTGYEPYPRLAWPGFNPIVGVAILLLVSPVVLLGQPGRAQKEGNQH